MEIDLKLLIQNIGYAGIFGIVFAESGLFFGCFLPGDSLLFMAGFLASQGLFSLPILLVGCFLAAVLGDNVGYAFGHKFGRKLFQKEDSFFFRKENLLKTEDFYKKHGAKTIILARFIPIIRTFAPIVAGLAGMDYKSFLRYNLIGGMIWGVGVTAAGYFLGKAIPDAEHYLLPIVIGIVIISVIPAVIHYIQEKSAAKS